MGAHIISVEFAIAPCEDSVEVSEMAVQHMTRECINALWGTHSEPPVGIADQKVALQVQYSVANAHGIVAKSVQGALCSIGMSDSCAVSYMPALGLGQRICIRIIAIIANSVDL